MGPARLGALLARWSAAEAWALVLAGPDRSELAALEASGVGTALWAPWRAAARSIDVPASWAALAAAGVGVVTAGDPTFPAPFLDDPEPPAVIFHRGALASLDRPRVAIVGTRRCTGAGRDTARSLGRDLAAAGVCVVSGLALGIDGAAHGGTLEAGGAAPAAVVGTGLDVVYPRRHAELWARVAEAGVVLSEYPLGVTPERWRFPARNRLIAALADVVVVVESHARGGSMHTVEAALERERTVMAVPGPVRSPASAGTNALLADGGAVVRDVDDVLVVLGLTSLAAERGRATRPAPGGEAGVVLAAVGHTAVTLQRVADEAGLGLAAVAVHLAALERDAWITRTGGWYERRSR